MEWISVKDELPEGDCLVLVEAVGRTGCRMHVASYSPNITIVGNHFSFDMPDVTHWMPLPEPPTELLKKG